ncbi:hypothetical protein FRB95_007780 [Tulasnella sp. JGI-2019a]|nr:hypothetical protein FRB95_007780 [Tulasnella sp. JGI-2019a]
MNRFPRPEVPPPSCRLQDLLQLKQLVHFPAGTDSSQYIITNVGWWQEMTFWNHQYVIVRAIVPRPKESSILYFRFERHKTEWLDLSKNNILDHIIYSVKEADLTHDSEPVAHFDVSYLEEDAAQSRYNIQMLAQLIKIINEEAPSYSLPSVNCWWFAGCITERLAQQLGQNRTRPRSRLSAFIPLSREQEYQELIESCYSDYFRLIWPYWAMPILYVLIPDIGGRRKISSPTIVALLFLLVLIGITCQYAAVSSAWGRVQNRFRGGRCDHCGAQEFGFSLSHSVRLLYWPAFWVIMVLLYNFICGAVMSPT